MVSIAPVPDPGGTLLIDCPPAVVLVRLHRRPAVRCLRGGTPALRRAARHRSAGRRLALVHHPGDAALSSKRNYG